MRPILMKGHERPLTQVKYNRDSDLVFSVAKDYIICVWFVANGERLGTYHGHNGALWSIDSDPTSTLLASGSADNTMRLWDIKTGNLLKTWEYKSSVKRVEFSTDGTKLLGVTERRTNSVSSIVVYNIVVDVDHEQNNDHTLRIVCEDSKATVAGFSYGAKYIISGHEDGSVSQWDCKSGTHLNTITPHKAAITDLQWSPDRTYFVTASKDQTAKLISTHDLQVLKTYVTDTSLNSAAITPLKNFVILGGGQAAIDVTTTSARHGKFEARFHHKIFEEEIGRLRGHFGPLNYIAVSPDGKSYCSGGEDGYVRLHHFDRSYFDFMFEVEADSTMLTR